MSDIKQDFVASALHSLVQQERALIEEDIKIRTAMTLHSMNRRSVMARIKQAVELFGKHPELFEDTSSTKNIIKNLGSSLGYMEEQDTKSPVETLLNWGLGDKDKPFIINEAYDILGKEDARTLRCLIRNVVAMVDPSR